MLAGVLLLFTSRQATDDFVTSEQQVKYSYRVLGHLEHLGAGVERIETARRAYSIAPRTQPLRTFDQAHKEVYSDLAALESLVANKPLQQQQVATLRNSVDELISIAKEFLHSEGIDAARSAAVLAQARVPITRIRGLIGQFSGEEKIRLSNSLAVSSKQLHSLRIWMFVTGAAFIVTLCLAFVQSYREISQRRKAELYLLKSQQHNMAAVHNLSLIAEMSSLLQVCTTVGESLDVIAQYVPRLIHADGGALYLFRDSRSLLECHVHWGKTLRSEPVFEPQDCWALRRGDQHIVNDGEHALACQHLQHAEGICAVCTPVVAQGNVLGILYLENCHGRSLSEAEIPLTHNLASQIALALASIQLRETLHNLSVRDSLTGLYNRHYMEESLQRELASAQRKERPLAVVMMDLDYFKDFNDLFGHEAGDLLLAEVGLLLIRNLRSSDIACRFGGEEFVLIFTETEPENVVQLVNQLREGIASLHVQYFGQSLGKISASFGMAFFPMHGNTIAELLRAADQALYMAKAEGRDRVEIADSTRSYIKKSSNTPNDEPGSPAAA